MEYALTCNNLMCRKKLEGRALVTTCSHIFCLDCVHRLGLAGQETPRGASCPVCSLQISTSDDAAITNLNPSEGYKTCALSGLSPSVIMECASRALGFWEYQTTQQIHYQQHLYNTLKEKHSNMTVRLDQTVGDANAEIERLQHIVNSSAAEQEDMRRSLNKVKLECRDKNRKLMQTQELYDKVKMKAELGHIQRAASEAVDSTLHVVSQSQTAVREFEGHNPDTELNPRNTFDLFGQTNRFDVAGVNSDIPRPSPHHVGVEDRWMRPEAALKSAGRYVPVGSVSHQRPGDISIPGSTSHPGVVGTPVPHSISSRRPRGTQTIGLAQHRGGLSGIGLTSGLKVSQPMNTAGLGI